MTEPDRSGRAAAGVAAGRPISPGAGRRGARARWGRVGVALALSVVAALGACGPINPTEDARIEAEVKARLVAEKAANLTRLGVLSRAGTVYLSGTVESTDQRARAEVVARAVRGVGRVVNTLDVRPESE